MLYRPEMKPEEVGPRGDTAVSYPHSSGRHLYPGVGLWLVFIRRTNRKPQARHAPQTVSQEECSKAKGTVQVQSLVECELLLEEVMNEVLFEMELDASA